MAVAELNHALLSQRIASSSSLDALTEIYQQDVNIAIWQRALSSSIAAESEALLARSGFTGCKAVLSEPKLDQLVQTLKDLAQCPHLLEDIKLLVNMFCCLFEIDRVGLRLTPLTSAMCPKFHVDHVPCRLVTSYHGIGTQWLPHGAADRTKLGAGSLGKTDSESGLYTSADDIQNLTVGDVALLKGEAWEGNEGAGLVHRSPEVLANQKRLLMTLDFV